MYVYPCRYLLYSPEMVTLDAGMVPPSAAAVATNSAETLVAAAVPTAAEDTDGSAALTSCCTAVQTASKMVRSIPTPVSWPLDGTVGADGHGTVVAKDVGISLLAIPRCRVETEGKCQPRTSLSVRGSLV